MRAPLGTISAPSRRHLGGHLGGYLASVSDRAYSLGISAGRNGARLSHNHATQFAYVEQSLLLWREILSHLSQVLLTPTPTPMTPP